MLLADNSFRTLMSAGEEKAFRWGRVAEPAASVNFADVMSEELADQLQKEEQKAASGPAITHLAQQVPYRYGTNEERTYHSP